MHPTPGRREGGAFAPFPAYEQSVYVKSAPVPGLPLAPHHTSERAEGVYGNLGFGTGGAVGFRAPPGAGFGGVAYGGHVMMGGGGGEASGPFPAFPPHSRLPATYRHESGPGLQPQPQEPVGTRGGAHLSHSGMTFPTHPGVWSGDAAMERPHLASYSSLPSPWYGGVGYGGGYGGAPADYAVMTPSFGEGPWGRYGPSQLASYGHYPLPLWGYDGAAAPAPGPAPPAHLDHKPFVTFRPLEGGAGSGQASARGGGSMRTAGPLASFAVPAPATSSAPLALASAGLASPVTSQTFAFAALPPLLSSTPRKAPSPKPDRGRSLARGRRRGRSGSGTSASGRSCETMSEAEDRGSSCTFTEGDSAAESAESDAEGEHAPADEVRACVWMCVCGWVEAWRAARAREGRQAENQRF